MGADATRSSSSSSARTRAKQLQDARRWRVRVRTNLRAPYVTPLGWVVLALTLLLGVYVIGRAVAGDVEQFNFGLLALSAMAAMQLLSWPLARWNLSRVRVARSVDEKVTVGDPFVVRTTVWLEGGWIPRIGIRVDPDDLLDQHRTSGAFLVAVLSPAPRLRPTRRSSSGEGATVPTSPPARTALDSIGKPGAESSRAENAVWAGASRTGVAVDTRTVLRHRGPVAFSFLRLTTRFPFGLLCCQQGVDAPYSLLVRPARLSGRAVPTVPVGAGGPTELADAGRQAGHDEYFGVRDFREGDPYRHIHWKASARLGELRTREFAAAAHQPVIIVLDTLLWRPSPRAWLDMEIGISYATTLLAAYHQAGRSVRIAAASSAEVITSAAHGGGGGSGGPLAYDQLIDQLAKLPRSPQHRVRVEQLVERLPRGLAATAHVVVILLGAASLYDLSRLRAAVPSITARSVQDLRVGAQPSVR